MKLLAILFLASTFYAQTFSLQYETNEVSDTVNSEIVFDILLTNTTNNSLDLYVKRTLNDIEPGWSSSLCFTFCFSPTLDSIATTSTFGSRSLSAGESREVSLHVFPQDFPGNGEINLRFGNVADFADSQLVNFSINVTTSDINSENISTSFALLQNYPNPFNPSTIIKYSLKESSVVKITVHNLLGEQVAELLNKPHSAGNYEVEFIANDLPSGVYFYQLLTSSGFSEIKKMILLK